MKVRHVVGSTVVFLGAICFSAKAVIVKLAYQYHIDAITLLTLRMVFSFPFFLIIGLLNSNREKKKITARNWFYIVFLGFIGYHLASIFDFSGLQYVTASMERLILFVYPTIVVVLSAILFKKKIKPVQYFALALTYLGVFIAFASDLNTSNQKDLPYGAFLIFLSAFTYAVYLVGSGNIIPKVGSIRFTAFAMSFAALAVSLQYLIFHPLDIFDFPKEVYYHALLMAVLSTVIPSFMISEGIRLIGSGNASIIASVGPVSTIVLAYFFLNESITFIQLLGTVLVLLGVLLITLKGSLNK